MAKVRIRAGDPSALPVLAYVLEKILRLLHPFMPFVTEAIWQQLTDRLPDGSPGADGSLMVARYPGRRDGIVDERAESEVETVMELVRAVRNLRAEFRIQPGRTIAATVDSAGSIGVMMEEAGAIGALASIDPLTFGADGTDGADGASLVLTSSTVSVPLAGLVDVGAEIERLESELASLGASAARLERRLDDEQFLTKAPPEVVERERERLSGLMERRERVRTILERLGS